MSGATGELKIDKKPILEKTMKTIGFLCYCLGLGGGGQRGGVGLASALCLIPPSSNITMLRIS